MKTLFDVQPGGLLIVDNARGRRIVEVEHETKTQIKTKDGVKWNKKTARMVGSVTAGGWYAERIRVSTEGELEELQINGKCRRALIGLQDSLKEIGRKAEPSYELFGELIQANARLRKFLKDGQDGGDG